jgi:outer membrane protein TolC
MRTTILKISGAILVILAQCAVATGEPNSAILPAIVEPNRFLTLEDYVSYAEAHNPALKNSYQQWMTATEQAIQAKSLPEPQLTFVQEADVYERQMVILTQMFPWFGKISARVDAAVRNAEAAKQKYQAARLSLRKEVKRDFYEYACLAESVNIAGENIELMKRFEEIATAKRLAAEMSPPDVVRAQAETEKLENTSKGLERLCEPTVSRLKAALNLPAGTNLPAPQQKDFKPAAIDYELLVNLLKQKNPELAGLGYEAMAAKSKVKLAEKNFYPDIGIGLQFEQMKRPGGNTQDSYRDTMLFLSLNVPLWQDSYRGEQRRAVAEAASIEQRKIEAENSILTKASQAYYEYNDSIKRIGLYRETLIPKAEEQLRSSEAAYRGGSVDFIALLDAQQTLMDYRLAYQRVLADNRQKLAELEMLAGTDLDKQQ